MTGLKKRLSSKVIVTSMVMVLVVILAGSAAILRAEKESGKGYLGVNIETMSKDDKEEFGVKFGVLIVKVIKGEAADKAGIKKYDVIQYYNGERIRRSHDLMEATRHSKPGAKANVKLVREEKKVELTVTVGELKSEFHSYKWKDKYGDRILFTTGRAYLGVSLQELNKDLAEYFNVKVGEGTLILNVAEDSPAEKAGLKAGDIIVKFDGKEISKSKDINEILSQLEKDDDVDINIIRHNKKITVKAKLDEMRGFKGIEFLEGPHDKLHYKIPDSQFFSPRHKKDVIIMRDHAERKINNKIKNKLQKVHERLENIDEYVCI